MGLMRDELSGKIMMDCAAFRPKTYSYLTNDNNWKGTKKCVIKQKLTFEDCKHSSKSTQLENEINQPEKK